MSEKQTSIERVMSTSTGLKRTMSTNAAVMVGVGGTIGTGLFLSSGDVSRTWRSCRNVPYRRNYHVAYDYMSW